MADYFSCDYFSLFGLPVATELDGEQLRAKYQQLQATVHPDRFATTTAAEKHAAEQMASRVNEGYQILQNPLRRAAYLLELRGLTPFAEDNTAMPADFLMQQLEWRETLEATNGSDRESVLREITRVRNERKAQTFRSLNKGDNLTAVAHIRQWKYLAKLLAETSQE